jgi:hypothetical protein
VIRQSTQGPAHVRGTSTSIRVAAIGSRLGIDGRGLDQSSISLPRLLQIAQRAFDLKTEHQPWARQPSLALQSQRSAFTVISAPRISPHITRLYHPSWAHLGPSGQPAISRPFRSARPLVLLLTSSQLRSPVVRRGYAKAEPRQGGGQASQRIIRTTPTPRQSCLDPVTQSISLEAMVRVLGSQLSGIGHTSVRSRSPSKQIRTAGLRHVAVVASFLHNHRVDEPFASVTGLTKISARPIPTAPSSRSSMLLRPKTAESSSSDAQDSIAEPNKIGRGSLFLDGAALGRWLMQYLDREIMRPRGGIMAVDPRATPSWGGPSLPT